MSITADEAPDIDTAPVEVIKRPSRASDSDAPQPSRRQAVTASPSQREVSRTNEAVQAPWPSFSAQLHAQLDAEVRAMLRHAFANGIEIPSSLSTAIATVEAAARTEFQKVQVCRYSDQTFAFACSRRFNGTLKIIVTPMTPTK